MPPVRGLPALATVGGRSLAQRGIQETKRGYARVAWISSVIEKRLDRPAVARFGVAVTLGCEFVPFAGRLVAAIREFVVGGAGFEPLTCRLNPERGAEFVRRESMSFPTVGDWGLGHGAVLPTSSSVGPHSVVEGYVTSTLLRPRRHARFLVQTSRFLAAASRQTARYDRT